MTEYRLIKQMVDFQFLQNPVSKKWVISAPRRAKRPDVAAGVEPICPFCPGREGEEAEVFRISASDFPSAIDHLSFNEKLENSSIGKSVENDTWKMENKKSDWFVRVLPNKFPFAPIHEVIIHSPDHHKNFGELPLSHVQLILQTYKQRFNTHKEKGQVYIFHNRGEGGGESLPHPHSQIAVVPYDVEIDTPRLDSVRSDNLILNTKYFILTCPRTSQWPDEVWVAPLARGRAFGEITDEEIGDLSHVVSRLVQIFNLRHGQEFPFNFYIYPGGDWYLRLIPRAKVIGGFELGTGIFVNTQDPAETLSFIKEHFENPNEEKIRASHQADYEKVV